MELAELEKSWDQLGSTDPFWAILSVPEKMGRKWDVWDFFRTGQEEIARIVHMLQSRNIKFARGRALDFGCGVGRLTQALALHFDFCHGVDIAPSMINQANHFNRHGVRCRYHLNEADHLGLFPDNYFDFVYTNIVLQHMQPKYSKKYIQEFVRVLAPGGILLFQVPSEMVAGTPGIPGCTWEPLPDTAFRAGISLRNFPITLSCGAVASLAATIKNLSKEPWSKNGRIKLGNHWLDENGKIMVQDDGRANLTEDLGPGQEVNLGLQIKAPERPGHYIVQLDMVQELVAWFEKKGSATVSFRVKVEGKGPGLTSQYVNYLIQPPQAAPSSSPVPGRESPPAKIEMYGLPKATVLEVLERSGGKIVEVTPDHSAGRDWNSYLYCVTK